MALMIEIDEVTLANEFANDPVAFGNLLYHLRCEFKKPGVLADWAKKVQEELLDDGAAVVSALKRK